MSIARTKPLKHDISRLVAFKLRLNALATKFRGDDSLAVAYLQLALDFRPGHPPVRGVAVMSWSTRDPARKLVALPTELPPTLPGISLGPPAFETFVPAQEDRPVTVIRDKVVEETYTVGAGPARSQAEVHATDPARHPWHSGQRGLARRHPLALVADWFDGHCGVVAGAMYGYALYPSGARP